MSQIPMELKGSNFTLSVIYLRSSDPTLIHQYLIKKMDTAPKFLLNAPVVLNLSALSNNIDLIAIKEAVAKAGVLVVGVSGCESKQKKALSNEAGLPILTEGKGKKTEKIVVEKQVQAPQLLPSMLVTQPVRTGQQIYARNCDLIVTSRVNAGAELIADGNIHIYGAMKGRALAGASGDDKAQIFCTQLSAELVSISGQYWLSEQIPNEFFGNSVQLSIKNGSLAIQYLN